MSTSYNDGFSRVLDNNINTNNLPAALAANNLPLMKAVYGTVSEADLKTLDVAGDIIAVKNGTSNVSLPANALVQHIVLRKGTEPLVSATPGTTDLTLSLGSNATSAETPLHAAAATAANINLHTSPDVTQINGVSNTFLTVKLITVPTITGGDLEVIVHYL